MADDWNAFKKDPFMMFEIEKYPKFRIYVNTYSCL